MGRDLSHYVAGCPGYVDEIQLVGIHAEVLFHARDIGVGDVGLVKVLNEIAQREDSEERDVKLLNKFAFFQRAVGIIVL